MPEIKAQVGPTLRGLTRELDIIAHNLANVNTAGYKRRVNDFTKAMMSQKSASADGAEGTVTLQTTLDFSQGNLIETGRSLDMALYGSGFFVIETPHGPLYTRNGAFRVNPNGQIVDLAGRMVAGDAGPLTVPPSVDLSQITISGDGRIMTADGPIGKFKLVDFQEQQNKLVPAGLNCYQSPMDITPVPASNIVVKQGFQEGSNVQLVEELVDMIMVSRLYEANMKSISKNSEASKSLLDIAMSG